MVATLVAGNAKILWWGLAESTFGRSLVSGGQFTLMHLGCEDVFRLNSVYAEILIFTFSAIWRDMYYC
jgi:hypothetical protein